MYGYCNVYTVQLWIYNYDASKYLINALLKFDILLKVITLSNYLLQIQHIYLI